MITKRERRKNNMKHNSYFEGKVQSLGINTPEGYATVGVIEPGQYTFSTDSEERMSIVAGSMKVRLPDKSWQTVGKNETFVVPPHVSFDIDAAADVAYICYYRK
jgi:purine/pyrimidine-nucleoside phosphorylase